MNTVTLSRSFSTNEYWHEASGTLIKYSPMMRFWLMSRDGKVLSTCPATLREVREYLAQESSH
jgi:hypothetical protein